MLCFFRVLQVLAAPEGRMTPDAVTGACHASSGHRIGMSISSALVTAPAGAGKIGVISQSGGIISAMVDRASEFGVGFSHLIATGDEFDLEVADYLNFLVFDPATAVIAIHAESFKYPQKFLHAANRAREYGNAVLLLKPGRSVEAMQAAMSHSGRITGSRQVQQAVLERNGVVLVDDIDDLWLAPELIARHGRLQGKIGAVSTSGGFTAVVADSLNAAGVPLAKMSEKTIRHIRDTGVHLHPSNPIDAAARGVPGLEPDDVEISLRALAADEEVGATLYAETLFLNPDGIVDKLIDVSRTSGKPHITAWQAGPSMSGAVERLRSNGVLAVSDVSQAVRAFAVLRRYTEISEASHIASPETPAPQWLHHLGAGPVGDQDLPSILATNAIPYVQQVFSASAEGAAAAAGRMTFPVVLKGHIPDCLHKSELGLVKLNLQSEEDVLSEARGIKKANPDVSGFIVQSQIKGEEFIVGVNSEENYGAAIVLARGGVFAETAEKVAVEALPVTPEVADRMIDIIDPKGILKGYRGKSPLARVALIDFLCSVSRFVEMNLPRIKEIDFNPVIVTEQNAVAVDAVVILR